MVNGALYQNYLNWTFCTKIHPSAEGARVELGRIIFSKAAQVRRARLLLHIFCAKTA